MAETLVLARLSYDTAGVSKGSDAVVKSSGQMQSSMSVLTRRMFSLRTVALRLGTALGVAGAAFAAIRAVMRVEVVQQFTAELGKMATNFATAAVEGFGLGRVLSIVTGWMKSANDSLTGPESFVDALQRMNLRDPREQLADLVQILARINREADSGALPFYLQQIGQQAAAIKKAFPGVFVPGQLAALMPSEPSPAGPKARTPYEVAGIPSPDQVTAGVAEVRETLAFLNANQATIGIELWDRGVGNLAESLQQLGLTAGEIRDVFASMGVEMDDVLSQPDQWRDFLAGMAEGASEASLKIGAVNAAMSVMSDLATTVGEGGALSFKKFVGEVLKATAQMLFTLGAALIAKGYLENRHDLIYQGFAAIAAGFAAMAAAAQLGKGGVAAGPRGGGGGGGGGGRRRGGTEQTINLYINGSLVTDPAEFARYIARILRDAQLDGAP